MDRYTRLVSSAPGSILARRLGLPRPAPLIRREARPEPVLSPFRIIGNTPGAHRIGGVLEGWGGVPASRTEGVGTVVIVLDELVRPADLDLGELPAIFRAMASGGRVIFLARSPKHPDPVIAAARGGIDGLMRTLAKEARKGITVNGIYAADHLDIAAPSILSALRFFCSAGSAFVTGQMLDLQDAGRFSGEWERPLAGSPALITGAARGIGAAIAARLAQDGAEPILVDLPGQEELEETARAVGGHAIPADITEPGVLPKELERRGLAPRILVHNAGITRDGAFVNLRDRDFRRVLSINLSAQLELTRALWRPDLSVVSLSSISGIAGNAGQANYAYAKAGILAMIDAQARALAPSGGTANAVAPGFIETEMTARIPPLRREVFRRANSLSQPGLPEDVAEAVSFLSSGGVTGQVLRVCGQNLLGR